MTAKLVFWGGAGSVTGANFMLETGTRRILVDCGIQEREHVCDERNYGPFPYDPKSIDVLFVTHAHADHIGRIPKLVHEGFSGEIFSTAATKDIATLMFDDALTVMRRSAETAQCGMLYDQKDVERTLALWRGHGYHEEISLEDGATVTFLNAGHILGSAMVQIRRGGKNILFTGDLGNSPEPLLPETESPEGAHYLVIESVYGDRLHENKEGRRSMLKAAVEQVRKTKGVLLIPSFSIERTQILLSEFDAMIGGGEMQPIQMYLDAPLATKITGVYRHYVSLLNADIQHRFQSHDDPFSFSGLTITRTPEESRAIHEAPDPKVIIAGSGMSSGGRIREHERRYLADPKSTVLFVGYQAPGSLGRRIADGEGSVTIDGQKISVRAQVATLTGYSGHKDRDGLLSFAELTADTLERAFVVMGEPKASAFLSQRLHDFLGINAVVPESGQSFEIEW